MAMIVADFKEPVVSPNGLACHAKACGLSTTGRGWQGWIEFSPLDGSPTFRGPYEVVQSSKQELRQWAHHLTKSCLEEALDRALGRLRPWSIWEDIESARGESERRTG